MENQLDAVKPPNPFNPSSPVDPSDFVGRVQELENFRQKLRQTAAGSLASMAVAGGYGVGKTSFLHKCKSIAEEQGALVVYFSISELDWLDKASLARVLMARIRDKVSEEVILKRLSQNILDVVKKIRVSAGSIELSLDATRPDEFPYLQSALAAAWNSLAGSKIAIVFLIDEAGVLEKNRAELLLYLRAVLEQLQASRTPVMAVPAGKLSIMGPSGSGFSPLVRTFPPALLENFTFEESALFAQRKLHPAGISIKPPSLNLAYSVTEGHPFVLTAYLATAYDKLQLGESELTEVHFKAADVEFVDRVLAQFFARFYDQVGKSSREILAKMAFSPNHEITLAELTVSLGKDNNQLSPFLAKLVQDGAIIRIDRGKYKLFHHLLAQYIRKRIESVPEKKSP